MHGSINVKKNINHLTEEEQIVEQTAFQNLQLLSLLLMIFTEYPTFLILLGFQVFEVSG